MRVFQQSPIFNAPPKPVVFNGTSVGATQYRDAFQRANFWTILGEDTDQSAQQALLFRAGKDSATARQLDAAAAV